MIYTNYSNQYPYNYNNKHKFQSQQDPQPPYQFKPVEEDLEPSLYQALLYGCIQRFKGIKFQVTESVQKKDKKGIGVKKGYTVIVQLCSLQYVCWESNGN